jgi:hypothetical protein
MNHFIEIARIKYAHFYCWGILFVRHWFLHHVRRLRPLWALRPGRDPFTAFATSVPRTRAQRNHCPPFHQRTLRITFCTTTRSERTYLCSVPLNFVLTRKTDQVDLEAINLTIQLHTPACKLFNVHMASSMRPQILGGPRVPARQPCHLIGKPARQAFVCSLIFIRAMVSSGMSGVAIVRWSASAFCIHKCAS